MSIQDHPEPVEPVLTQTPDGLYCLVHGVMECEEPFCWRCGNHLMDSFGRCADQACRATCTPEAMALVEELKANWRGPVPLEVITVVLGGRLSAPSSLPAGDSTGGGADDPSASGVPG